MLYTLNLHNITCKLYPNHFKNEKEIQRLIRMEKCRIWSPNLALPSHYNWENNKEKLMTVRKINVKILSTTLPN